MRESYDRIATEYAQRLFDELRHKPFDRDVLDRFAADIAEGGSVCDMGCGPGHVARYLDEIGANVFGLDFSPGMVNEARVRNASIRFIEGDMRSLPLVNASLAGIVAFYSIVNIHESELNDVFREMHRTLREGGLLLLAFHVGEETLEISDLWGESVSLRFFFFRPSTIVALLEQAGFTIEDVQQRLPYAPEVEYQSRRAYVFARKHGPR
jgi:SAM-dependent methyltransferase